MWPISVTTSWGDYEQMTVAVSAMQRLMMIVDECSGPLLFRHNNNNNNSVLSAHQLPVSEEEAASLMINARMLQEPCTAGAA